MKDDDNKEIIKSKFKLITLVFHKRNKIRFLRKKNIKKTKRIH